MENRCTSNQRGFTLLEVLLSLFLVTFLGAMSFYLSINISKRHRLSMENMAVDNELHTLTEAISEDLSCIILIDKGFPAFEFKIDGEGKNFFISFFSSNNGEHITKAVRYCIKADGDLRKSFTRSELSASDSLLMQNTLDRQSSLCEDFSKYAPSATKALGGKLVDFNVRVAVRMPSGGIFISPTNANLIYKDGYLYYPKCGTTMRIRGTPLFVDITTQALTNTMEKKLLSANFESNRERAQFLDSGVRRSFRRIAIKSHFF